MKTKFVRQKLEWSGWNIVSTWTSTPDVISVSIFYCYENSFSFLKLKSMHVNSLLFQKIRDVIFNAHKSRIEIGINYNLVKFVLHT